MKRTKIINNISSLSIFIIFVFCVVAICSSNVQARYIFPDVDNTPVIEEDYSFKCGKDVIWKYDYKSETVTISGNGPMYDESWEFANGLEAKYHSNRKTVRTVVVEEGVTSISKYAFSEFKSLKTAVLDNSVKTINDGAFESCTALKTVILSEDTVRIGDYAFNLCTELEYVEIPDSVEYIGSFCFGECMIKGDLQLPSELKHLGECAFFLCGSLEEVIIPVGVTDIYAETFAEQVKIVVLNKNCVIHGGIYAEISGYDGSKAQEYSKKNAIPFNALEEHAHSYTKKVTRKATCKKKGLITYTCYCGETYTKSIAKTEHTYETKITKATTSKDGKIIKSCTTCGEVKSSKVIYKISSIKLSKTSYTYDGKVKTPVFVIKDSKGNTLKKDTDYTVKYSSGRKAVGTYKAKVTFKGKYSGTKTLRFKIVLGKVTGIESSKSGNIVRLKWDKVKGATGYQVYEYSTEKGKFIKTGTFRTNALKNSELTKNTKLRIRAYYVDNNGKTHYGAFSDTVIILK